MWRYQIHGVEKDDELSERLKSTTIERRMPRLQFILFRNDLDINRTRAVKILPLGYAMDRQRR